MNYSDLRFIPKEQKEWFENYTKDMTPEQKDQVMQHEIEVQVSILLDEYRAKGMKQGADEAWQDYGVRLKEIKAKCEKELKEVNEKYAKGFSDGQKAVKNADKQYIEETYNDGYDAGLKMGRKQIWDMFYLLLCTDKMSVYDTFGYETVQDFMTNVDTPEAALQKLFEYKKANNVEVGDEIYSEMTKSYAVVNYIDSWGRWQVLTVNGQTTIEEEKKKYWKKTGKHYTKLLRYLVQREMDEQITADQEDRD